MNNDSSEIVIIGASGFIGSHLINKLTKNQDCRLRLLHHKNSTGKSIGSNIKIITGDLFNLHSLKELITESSIVINLVYLSNSSSEQNLLAISNIIETCVEKKVKRLIHCSTAVVCGRAPDDSITEDIINLPFDEYEKIKLSIENLLIERAHNKLELAIVRPTCVFGEQGKNLLMLINDLKNGNKIKNYFKSCLYNSRTMNLVSVHKVVAAIDFLINYQKPLINQVFIVADDEDPNNNFRTIENKIMNDLGMKNYLFPRITCPSPVLSFVLGLARKSNINPKRRFRSDKLKSLGWKSDNVLTSDLTKFLLSVTDEKK